MLQIQRALRGRRVADAVGLLRAARDIYPDTTFGAADGETPEGERKLLEEMFNLQLTDIAADYEKAMREKYGEDAAAATANDDANDEAGGGGDKQEAAARIIDEKEEHEMVSAKTSGVSEMIVASSLDIGER